MYRIVLSLIIIYLFLSPVFAASGVSTTSKNRVEGIMEITSDSIKQSNKKLREEIISDEKENEYLRKTLDDYRSKLIKENSSSLRNDRTNNSQR